MPTPRENSAARQTGADALEQLLLAADDQARKLHAPQVDTGHILLALIRASDSEAAGLLADDGVEYPLAATQVEKLARMQEGGDRDDPMTGKAQAVVQAAFRFPAGGPGERLLAVLLADGDTIGTRVLEKLGCKLDVLRRRADRLVADPEQAAAAAGEGLHALTPEQYAAMSIDGDYTTAVQKKPFHVQVRYGDVHIYSGWRFKKKAYDGDGNAVLWEKEKLIREAVAFVRRMGEVELGPCAENKVPGPDTFEAFLRQFSINGNLASYIPSVLEKIGAIRLEKRAKGTGWAVPADGRDATADAEAKGKGKA